MGDYSERETHSFFGYLAALSIEERNDLDDYLRSLPEFKQWDETGFMMGVKQKMLKASARAAGRPESLAETCEEIRLDFRKYKELEDTLRRKVKAWCRAMAEELA